MRSLLFAALVIGAVCAPASLADEPNETFADRTILSPGVLTVSDDLFAGGFIFPDTLLAVNDSFGFPIETDDDDSIFGDGFASGISDTPVGINNEIDFTVTGFGDDFFDGSHSEFGEFEAVVDVYNFLGGLEDTFTVFGTLEPGIVESFTFSDSDWLAGTYDVNIDNTVGPITGGDVDFFTFTGLSPGASFSAETVSVGSIDTMLFWFDDFGDELDFNDDFNEVDFLSQIQGTVPSSGELTFAVTGFGDDFLEGSHSEEEIYDLQLTVGGENIPGDFDNDGDVDGSDLLLIQQTDPSLIGAWRTAYDDEHGLAAQATAVPEPATACLVLLSVGIASPALRRLQSHA